MKKLLTLLVLIISLPTIYTFGQNVGINDDASTPNASAMLDVKSINRGVLLPRVALTSTTSASPVTSPAAGLVVYNTATTGDVTPGYYYWDGTSSWVRFNSGNSPLIEVTKTATGPLVKTDQIVLASNSITLTLPVVTSADNGLSITVKNVGTYTDLITVAGNGGATIDGLAVASLLTRWQGNTYIVSGANWVIKDKQSREDNVYVVSAKGSFTTIAEVIAFLGAHIAGPSTIRLGGGSYPVSATQAINFTSPLTIEGTTFGESTIVASAGAAPLFNCSTECYFKMLIFDGSSATGDGIVLSGTNKYHEVKDCNFIGFTRGIALTGSSSTVWVFETDFNNATGAGIEVAGGQTLKVSEADFISCAKGINLVSGNTPVISILNCTFYNSGTQTGIVYVPATFSTFSSMFITNNAWNNVGTFISGFDFTLSSGRDAKAFIENNAGLESKRPHCKIDVINSTDQTTITTAGTFYKAAWTNTITYTCKWTLGTGTGTGNRITYQPVNSRDVIITITGNLSWNGGIPASRTINYGICKGGSNTTRYGEQTIYCANKNQMYPFSTIAYLSDVAQTNYFEFFLTSSTDGDVITVSDVNLFANSQ